MRRISHEQSPVTRLLASLGALATLALLMLSGPLAGAASAQTDGGQPCPADLNTVPTSNTSVRFVKVAGLIDPSVRDYLLRELDKVEADPNAVGYVLWMNSKGSVLDDDD